MIKRNLTTEIEELKRFIKFFEDTGRKDEIARLEKVYSRTNDCIHPVWDFIATASSDHIEKTEHLKKLNKSYKTHREHALSCRVCQVSLDSIFTFTGYESSPIFPGIDTQKVLEAEMKSVSKNDLHLCKIMPPGFTRPAQLTYITHLSLEKAYEQFEATIQKPLGLVDAFEIYYVKKASDSGKGIPYFQMNLNPLDRRHKTNFAIRSRVK
ncbi:MAG: hypothetical protein WCX73_04430 [Candidatus Pacearchaeota archaeon]